MSGEASASTDAQTRKNAVNISMCGFGLASVYTNTPGCSGPLRYERDYDFQLSELGENPFITVEARNTSMFSPYFLCLNNDAKIKSVTLVRERGNVKYNCPAFVTGARFSPQNPPGPQGYTEFPVRCDTYTMSVKMTTKYMPSEVEIQIQYKVHDNPDLVDKPLVYVGGRIN
jgi:hypothetical protein